MTNRRHHAGFERAARRSIATFVFAVTGQLLGAPLLDLDVARWKLDLAAGLGSLLNLAYRWAEPIVSADNPVDLPKG